MKRTIPFLLALALPLAAGCASNPLRPDPAVDDEVRQLRQQLVDLQREARMNEVEITRLRQQVAELEARNGGARPTPASTAPARPVVTETPRRAAPAPRREPAVAAPAPSTSVPQRQASTPPAPTRTPPAPRPEPEIQDEAPAPAAAIEEEDLDVPAPTPAPSVQTPAPAPPASSTAPGDDAELLPAGSQALYDRGYTLYHQGRFVDAEASFQRFLQTNPDSELADNAQYWIGECRYARSDARGALAAFREVVEKHPKGNKVPDALLKAGQCLEAMGDIEGARVTYREVGRRFAGTTAAAVAEERRAKLP
jgi:tol-pal system protein YbgF